MVGLTAVSGCLVTDEISFHEPINNPPAFVAVQPGGVQLSEIVFIEIRDEPDWTFTFQVYEPDIEQQLDAHWQVLRGNGDDLDPVGDTYENVPVPPSGVETRDFDIRVDRGKLAFDSCQRVEIAVSGSFAIPFEGQPDFLDRDDRFDIAQFNFWIWEGEEDDYDEENLTKTCSPSNFQPAVPTGAAGEAAQ